MDKAAKLLRPNELRKRRDAEGTHTLRGARRFSVPCSVARPARIQRGCTSELGGLAGHVCLKSKKEGAHCAT